MANISGHQALLTQTIPEIVWSRDLTIVVVSARLSIALIPIALVWFFAARFARWMIALLAFGRLINLPGLFAMLGYSSSMFALQSTSMALAFIAAALLFTPKANDWFSNKGRTNAAIFE
ncbi:hypothetical protein [Pontixanthobacter luteolus]|uniref:hypothetical protein n=1 Tax=Pontixanthobacter luteolus TaxID=295089 RepID=UPI002302AB0D|nr:hypothetical protein [Pontixanthobacter luteolus]